MLRRCWMVISAAGNESVFVHSVEQRAIDYAAKVHGYVIQMIGQDHMVEHRGATLGPDDGASVSLATIEDIPQ